jgi:predicted amidohydrolase YtcJ
VTVVLSGDPTLHPSGPWAPSRTPSAARRQAGRAIGVNQRIRVQEAVQAHTVAASFALHRERDIGSIEAGKLADLVVLEQDLAGLPPADIAGVPVWMTVSDRAIVHQASG